MTTAQQLAMHFKQVYEGGNWTASNLKDQLAGISWQQAIAKVHNFNTVAALLYHINYYVHAMIVVLEGHPLNAHDKYSFDHPPIQSESDWQQLQDDTWKDAEQFVALVSALPDAQLEKTFADEKYGSYYRNILGVIEHTHYHLGQIALIKKILPMHG